MPNDRLDNRWRELVRLVDKQLWDHNQHPGGGVLKTDPSALKLSGILKDGGYFSVTLSEDQLLNGDLARIAQDFYAAYRAERDKP
jgi:hypothetical protein